MPLDWLEDGAVEPLSDQDFKELMCGVRDSLFETLDDTLDSHTDSDQEKLFYGITALADSMGMLIAVMTTDHKEDRPGVLEVFIDGLRGAVELYGRADMPGGTWYQ